MGSKDYNFKPSNWNLEEYIASRYHVSRMKREQAADLRLQADAIDDELQELQKQLEEKKDGTIA
jgi:hypothetical protein